MNYIAKSRIFAHGQSKNLGYMSKTSLSYMIGKIMICCLLFSMNAAAQTNYSSTMPTRAWHLA